jgi:prepilin-type N-terminal cleavage/methylation domain-containing protein/prepilin-type processing-associated H-X9-DG protein
MIQNRPTPSNPGNQSVKSRRKPGLCSSPCGFTIVELLVVIAIIAILIALLLPAVQAAREAARKQRCSSNLKQIGIAVLHYESDWQKLPAGAYWKPAPNSPDIICRGSILIRLLPYVEQQAIYDLFDLTQNDVDAQAFPGATTLLGERTIPLYICPSDRSPIMTSMGRAKHNYAASSGPTAQLDNPNCPCAKHKEWNKLALAPYEAPGTAAGVFCRNSVCCSLAEIIDGLSNTIFFGEVRPDCSREQSEGWAGSSNGQGLTSTLVPMNFVCNDDASPDGCRRTRNWNAELGFKSCHPGGAHFLFGDGAVHFLNETIDMQGYQYLGAKADNCPTPTLAPSLSARP